MARPKKAKPNRTDGRYEVKITIGKNMDGTPIRKSFYSSISKDDAKQQAEEYKLNQKVAQATGQVFIEKGTGFADWAHIWLETYKKPNVDENTYIWTYQHYVEKHIIPYFGNADLRTIQPVHIQEFFACKTYLSESALSKINLSLIGIFDSAIENDLCYKNPAKSKTITYTSEQIKKEKQVLSEQNIQTILTCGTLPEIKLMVSTGVRRGELCGLMWTDIDFDSGLIHIGRSVADLKGGGVKINPPKWNSYRSIPIDNPVNPNFRCFLEQLAQSKSSIYVFPNIHGKVQSPNAFWQKYKRAVTLLPDEIPRLTPHELRHTFGTALRRYGVDIYTIQKIMGHKDIQMTANLYVHNETDELKKAMNMPVQKDKKNA